MRLGEVDQRLIDVYKFHDSLSFFVLDLPLLVEISLEINSSRFESETDGEVNPAFDGAFSASAAYFLIISKASATLDALISPCELKIELDICIFLLFVLIASFPAGCLLKTHSEEY